MTPLDRAKLAAEADPAALPRFWALMLETPLCLPIEDADAQPLRPQVFPLGDGPVALAFDDDGRMAAFFEAPTPYVTMDGRALVALLAGVGLGLGLNLGDGPSATVIDAAAVAWLAAEAGGDAIADADAAGPVTVTPPTGAEASLFAALSGRLAAMPGMAAEALLARVRQGDAPARLTVVLAPAAAARRGAAALATALGRVAQPFAPAGEDVAVAVLDAAHPLMAAARRNGVDLLTAPTPPAPAPKPEGPPILR